MTRIIRLSGSAYYDDLASRARNQAGAEPPDEAKALLSRAYGLSQAGDLMRQPGPRDGEPGQAIRELIRDFEARGEAAYTAMYDARDHDVKDLKDDALFYLARALELARALGLTADATRLQARSDNILGVYGSQFRGVFR